MYYFIHFSVFCSLLRPVRGSWLRAYKFVGVILLFSFSLAACVSTPNKPVVASPVVVPESVPVAQPKVLSVTDRLLAQAEKRFKQGALLEPEEDNAFIRYRAILLMEPANSTAQAGLDAILLDAVSGARDELASSRVRAAQSQHDALYALFGRHTLLTALASDIQKARQKKPERSVVAPKKVTPPDTREYLDKDALSKRSTSIKRTLQAFAIQLSQTNESVLIYARNDAEGRWIYQQMREAVPDYRIRGDIRIGIPALRKLPPLD